MRLAGYSSAAIDIRAERNGPSVTVIGLTLLALWLHCTVQGLWLIHAYISAELHV
jgi:hypothetical protein